MGDPSQVEAFDVESEVDVSQPVRAAGAVCVSAGAASLGGDDQ